MEEVLPASACFGDLQKEQQGTLAGHRGSLVPLRVKPASRSIHRPRPGGGGGRLHGLTLRVRENSDGNSAPFLENMSVASLWPDFHFPF